MPRTLLVLLAGLALAGMTLLGSVTLDRGSLIAAQEASPVAATPLAGTEADLLRQIELDRIQALLDGDMANAAEVYAPEFVHINPVGVAVPRDLYVSRVQSGEHDYQILQPVTEITVHVSGDLAVLTYQDQVDLVRPDDHLQAFGWHTVIYERRDGRWLIVRSHTTEIQDPE